jgi:hypothetical protein
LGKLKLKLYDLLFLLADKQAECLNMLSHVAIGGLQAAYLVALPTARYGNLRFEFADAIGVWKRSWGVAIALFRRSTKSVEQLG